MVSLSAWRLWEHEWCLEWMLIQWPNYFEEVCRNRLWSCPRIAGPVTVTWLPHPKSVHLKTLSDRCSWTIHSVTEIRFYVMLTNGYIFLDTLVQWFLKWGRERHEYRRTSQHRHIILCSAVAGVQSCRSAASPDDDFKMTRLLRDLSVGVLLKSILQGQSLITRFAFIWLTQVQWWTSMNMVWTFQLHRNENVVNQRS
jgi:hypothetical protein